MSNVIGYVRVSTDRQELSLEVQREKIEAMAKLKDVKLAEVVVDEDESGKSLNRPGMQRVMEMVRGKKVGMVIVAKLDRLTRSVRDLGEVVDLFNRKDATLVSVAETIDTGSAGGRFMMNMLATVSQWERETISERTVAALRQKRKRGERAGNVPYGWRVEDGKLVEDEGEQETLREVRRLNDHGFSLRMIADRLNGDGKVTRRGTPWRFQYVANVLREG